VGNGMMELIEAKMVQSTLVSWMPSVGFMGIHPYLQTLVPQLLMVMSALVALVVMAKQRSVLTAQRAEG
jgi:high-affinity iron transporter